MTGPAGARGRAERPERYALANVLHAPIANRDPTHRAAPAAYRTSIWFITSTWAWLHTARTTS